MGDDSLEDEKIIQLYIVGDESAITETEKKYGDELKKLSFRITGSEGDSAECLNDALMQAWKTVGSVRPDSLRAYLAKVTRNISLDCLKKERPRSEVRRALLLKSWATVCRTLPLRVRAISLRSSTKTPLPRKSTAGLQASERKSG